MEHVLSATKQQALVQLMSSNPTLLNGLDEDFLASITLLSDPPKRSTPLRETKFLERKTIQLYPEDADFAEKKPKLEEVKRPSLTRATTVLLSPCSNAAAVAATASSKRDGRNMSGFSAPVARRTICPANMRENPPPIILFDDTMLSVEDEGGQTKTRRGSTKKRAKRARRRHKNGSSSGGSTNNSEDESNQHDKHDNCLASSAMTNDSSLASDSDEGHATNSHRASAMGDIRMTSRLLLDHHHFVSRDQWIPRSARKACYVCLREFKILRKRHSCRMCGEVICSRCSVFREVNLPVMENKFRICSCCFMAYRKKLEEGNQPSLEDENSDPVSDGSADLRESSTRGGSLSATSESPEARSSGVLPLSLSPSDSTSDRSSSRNTVNTMSDISFSSDTLFDMNFLGSRNMEEELEAALKAKQLEKEVEASQQRIEALEAQIATQESQQDLLSAEQQVQLGEARATIKVLQDKLRMQEVNARQAAHNRDSICLSKLRQTELYTNEDDESEALKKKLKVLERQLKLAGISVAEVIPYHVAKKKVEEISKRLQEIGSSEIVLEDKHEQAAVRKEYYILEQEMEKYHMALVMTDEYIEEQRRQEQEWEDANRVANLAALELLRTGIPVDISRLSERGLVELVAPSGIKFPAELARRLKRTNVLQLLRTDPKTIVKMHPSVIEGYRTTGLTLLERRALHTVMQGPFQEWKKQQKDEMAQKKYDWACKLKEAFVTAATILDNHLKSNAGSDSDDEIDDESHNCESLGLACPVRAEERVRNLYCGLGFTSDAEFITEDIVKSDPEGAGEKALLEAQAHAREMVANQRQRDLKTHYKMNMRNVAQAVGALEEMDSILEQVRALDESFPISNGNNDREQQTQCSSLLNSARELMLLLAKRAGICVTGKRDPAKDETDTRSTVEIREASYAIAFLQTILADVNELIFNDQGTVRENRSMTAAATFKAVQELLDDVHRKNCVALDELHQAQVTPTIDRISWKLRAPSNRSDEHNNNQQQTSNNGTSSQGANNQLRRPALPTSAMLFDAIKAKRKQSENRTSSNYSNATERESSTQTPQANKPLDLMAAIRARKRAQSNEDSANSET